MDEVNEPGWQSVVRAGQAGHAYFSGARSLGLAPCGQVGKCRERDPLAGCQKGQAIAMNKDVYAPCPGRLGAHAEGQLNQGHTKLHARPLC